MLRCCGSTKRLDRRAEIAKAGSRPNLADADPHGFTGDVDQALRGRRDLADCVHAAGVAVPAVLDDGDVDIDDVALLQALVGARDAVTHDMIHGGADRLGKAAVVERRRHRLLHVDDVLVAARVELVGGDAGHEWGAIMSSTSAASRPATRICSCSAGVLIVTCIGRVGVGAMERTRRLRRFCDQRLQQAAHPGSEVELSAAHARIQEQEGRANANGWIRKTFG